MPSSFIGQLDNEFLVQQNAKVLPKLPARKVCFRQELGLCYPAVSRIQDNCHYVGSAAVFHVFPKAFLDICCIRIKFLDNAVDIV